MIRDYARLFEVSEARAEQELTHRARASEFVERLANEHPGKFAGFEVVHEPQFKISVFVKGPMNAEIRGVGRAAERAGAPLDIVPGARMSLDELLAQQSELHSVLAPDHGTISSSLDVRSGRIKVALGPSPQGHDVGPARPQLPAQAAQVIDNLPPQARANNVLVEAFSTPVATEEHLYGGGQVKNTNSGALCSAGFAATRNGQYGYLTAGHCTGMNEYFDHLSTSTFPFVTQHIGQWGDVEFHTSSHVDRPWVFYKDKDTIVPIRSVRGKDNFAKGDWACMYTIRGENTGMRTSGYGCDKVDDAWTSATVDGPTAESLVRLINHTTTGGESGGPWRISHEAFGVHFGKCDGGWFSKDGSCFTRAALVDEAIGATILFG